MMCCYWFGSPVSEGEKLVELFVTSGPPLGSFLYGFWPMSGMVMIVFVLRNHTAY